MNLFKHYGVNCIPICGFELAYRIGISCIPYSSLSGIKKEAATRISRDGFFVETNGRELIYFNDENVNYERINMTILHEVAHDVLGHTGREELSEIEEAEASFFAKYAVAPPPLVHRLPIVSPETIKQAFQLSGHAAALAYDYYHKWLYYGKEYYLEYEETLLQLFKVSV